MRWLKASQLAQPLCSSTKISLPRPVNHSHNVDLVFCRIESWSNGWRMYNGELVGGSEYEFCETGNYYNDNKRVISHDVGE